MKTKFQALALAGTAVLAMSFGATGAQAAQVTAQAKAKIVQAVTLTKQSDLNFGTIVPFTAARDVTVSNAGAATCGADLVCAPNTSTAANFTITGSTGSSVSVSYPASVVLKGPGADMPVVLNATAPITLAAGNNLFGFGGRLTVGANQVEGQYTSANFDVTVNYN